VEIAVRAVREHTYAHAPCSLMAVGVWFSGRPASSGAVRPFGGREARWTRSLRSKADFETMLKEDW